MKKSCGIALTVLAFALFVFCGLSFAADEKAAGVKKAYLVYDLRNIDAGALELFKNNDKVLAWCQIDSDLIVICDDDNRPAAPYAVRLVKKLNADENAGEPYLAIRRGKDSPMSKYADRVAVLYETGPYTIFQAPPFVVNELRGLESNHFIVEKFDHNIPLRIDSKFLETPFVKPSREAAAVEADAGRLAGYIQKLEGFKTRYSYTDGYMKSAEWAAEEFRKMGLEVKFHEYSDGGRKQVNVVAQKSFDSGDKLFVICAHLDSTSPRPLSDAPGADDNASGSAGVLEAANILSKTPQAGKFRFVLFAGEEVGLKGSSAYVKELKDSGEIAKILGAVNFDMIGFDKTPPLSALFETYENHKGFIANFIAAAGAQTDESKKLKVSVSYRPWGSDHIPFLKAQVPCFLFIEDEFEANPNYHQTTDRFADVNLSLSAEFVRVTAAALLNMLAAEK